MLKVVLYELLALDGVAEEPSNWLFDGGDALVTNLGRVIGKQDTILLGRGTYDYWVDFWPTATMEPFASFINGTPKHVFTSSKPASDWAGSVFVDGPAVDHVAELRQKSGGDIGIHGSISLAQSLLKAELVDELRLVIAPTLAGTGRRLFGSDAPLQRFDLIESEQTRTGLMLLGYRRKGYEGGAPQMVAGGPSVAPRNCDRPRRTFLVRRARRPSTVALNGPRCRRKAPLSPCSRPMRTMPSQYRAALS